ncbi:MAG TPA: DNA-binding protein [bacterium]|uniref:Uncharacterized protein n=1 Tax=candidate division TA06 bacterium ADurb.Bin417 TaxID=1852828 RepID=A0A1V5MD39_UNCT6|nr:MAG: hypothetical protein BWY73_01156 [candidate division TA06 bacterium ADurb.Bin417]HNQ35827.1 DNA-binding protein [bacterium]HNS49398.1 DNA-binding protein [bacterium]
MMTLLLAFLLAAGPALPDTPRVSVSDLVAHYQVYDGKPVLTQGEAIGDLMLRGREGWVNISDGNAALGLYGTAETLKRIQYLGRFQSLGDRVVAAGIFHNACPVHSGQMDLHILRLEVVAEGKAVPEAFNFYKAGLAILLAIMAVGALLLRQFFRKATAGRPKRS